MVGGKLHNGMGIHGAQAVELIQIFNITIRSIFTKAAKISAVASASSTAR